MAKTRLTEEKRSAINTFMQGHFVERQDKSVEESFFKLMLKLINSAIREKYPERDMKVLRKYKLEITDRCLRFQQTSTGRVFGIEFDYGTDGISDLPIRRGCRSGDVFSASDELLTAFEGWESHRTANDEERKRKYSEYRSFLIACKTVEDVEGVVTLPADLRSKLTGTNTALVTVSEEVVTSLRSEFSEAA